MTILRIAQEKSEKSLWRNDIDTWISNNLSAREDLRGEN